MSNDASDFSSKDGEPDTSCTAINDNYQGLGWSRNPKHQLPCRLSHHCAWIWSQGYDVEETKTGERYWLCKLCHTAKRQTSHIWKISGGTGLPLKHMKEAHGLTEEGPATKKRSFFDAFKQPDGSPTARDRYMVHQLISSFKPQRFKTKLTRWIVHDNIAFNQVESPYFRDVMLELNGSLEEIHCLPNHRSIRDWIMKDYERYKGIIAEQLRNALGKIHMSFDLWTSRNLLTLCGIVVHFINQQGRLCTALLTLPEIVGSHTGVNIAEGVMAIINEFGLQNQIGYFVLDNADDNDIAVNTLANEFGFDAHER
jgi:hypothetical protein